MLPSQGEPINVRTTRLNSVIVGRTVAGVGSKAPAKGAASSASAAVSPAVAEAVGREGLLDAFCVLYDECDKEASRKRDRNVVEFVRKYRPIIEETRRLRVNIDDFEIKTLIGTGYYGQVHLVVERQMGHVYAMKKMKKAAVTSSQVKVERDIMSRRCSEWITNLQYAFQDHENLYLVMEFVPGGDLLNLMFRQGPFDEDVARFYLAELTLAIHSLHSMGYVHRDIKPENVLIDRLGHIKLADFGNAAALNRDGFVISFLPVGTPDYIAPELLQTISTLKMTESLHNVSCDFWSMGVIGYELICEATPFHEDNVHETYSKILTHCEESQLHENVTFPSDLRVSSNYKNFIESLLTSPSKRLDFKGIKEHPYFETIKWESLRSQVPPIIPTVKSDCDTSNFEDNTRTPEDYKDMMAKKPPAPSVSNNSLSGKDLPFIGYSFVHMEKQITTEVRTVDEAQIGKLNAKIRDLQYKLKERTDEIGQLRQSLLRAEMKTRQSTSQSMILDDAKEEIHKMKDLIKEKTVELANCKTQIKTLQNSLKVEEEMWQKKEATITDLLRMNRQKYEEAKATSEQRYERLIAEKKHELSGIIEKLDVRQNELTAKNEECAHLQQKIENYKEMLRQFKEQSKKDKEDFEKNRHHITQLYDQKLNELRDKLRIEKEAHTRICQELRAVSMELADLKNTTHSSELAKHAATKNNDEIVKRLNLEAKVNNELRALNTQLETKLELAQKEAQKLQLEVNKLDRELQVAECGKHFAEQTRTAQSSPYETAPGSLTELHYIEDQLRAELEATRASEKEQRERADKLQETVEHLGELIEKLNEQAQTPTKATLKKESLEEKLATLREQITTERRAQRNATLALWKVEKQLEETQTENKLTKRRMELTEERIKRVQAERDEAQRLCKAARDETAQRDARIKELQLEIASLKREVLREHRMWEKAEEERVKGKSELIQHIAQAHKHEERLAQVRQKLLQTQERCDALTLENRNLVRELNDERDNYAAATDQTSTLSTQLKNLKLNYDQLKCACSITDNQLTELEHILEAEQKRSKTQQEKIDALHVKLHNKDFQITSLNISLQEANSLKQEAEEQITRLRRENEQHTANMTELNKKIISQQQQLIEQTTKLFAAQERGELLTDQNQSLQMTIENSARQINILKEENSRVLSDLFHSKEEVQQLQAQLKDAGTDIEDLRNELSELQAVLAEKENLYLQHEIKSEATLAQHKKLIDYLQLKVEDLTNKKKKTLACKLFGSSSSARKENISPLEVQTSILYRTLKEELQREKLRNKQLQEQIDKTNGLSSDTLKQTSRNTLRSKESANSEPRSTTTISKSPLKASASTAAITNAPTNEQSHHRFELSLQETNTSSAKCLVCVVPIVGGTAYWKCKECKGAVHRKCRSNVSNACGQPAQAAAPNSDAETISLGKYSYEGKLDNDDCVREPQAECDYSGAMILSTDKGATGETLEVNCAYEMEEEKILLLGCNTGLYAYNIELRRLLHIAGIDSVNYIAVSVPLAKAILVGARGESLYQCDFRQLLSRCQASATVKPVLEASVLDLPFGNGGVQKWQLVSISNEAENALDSVAIAVTASRIVILKYDLSMHKFKPVRSLDTATPVSSVLYTRHTAIVSSDKFFEIDLRTYVAEEFVDLSDASLSHTVTCQPVVVISISKQEFLLCFMECGVFVDEYGCRSRPQDLNWEYTPTGFQYSEPFLYISHFTSVQVMRINRSYADADDKASANQRVQLPFYMPTLLAKSGDLNAYVIAIDKDCGHQQLYHLDALRLFKAKLNESLETLASSGTAITMGSLPLSDMESV